MLTKNVVIIFSSINKKHFTPHLNHSDFIILQSLNIEIIQNTSEIIILIVMEP